MDREQTGAAWASSEAEAAGDASMRWTAETMTEENRSWLRQLPKALRVDLAGRSVHFFHGSPLRENEYLWADRPSRVLARIASDEGDDLFCFGHTHEAFHRVVGQAHFVACGSVGCGTDGDARARYAVIYIGDPDMAIGFRSVDYDHLAVVRDMTPPRPRRWTCCACRRPRIRTSRTRARPSPRPPAPAGSAGGLLRRSRFSREKGRPAAAGATRAAHHARQDDDRDQVWQRAVELASERRPGSRRARPPAGRSARLAGSPRSAVNRSAAPNAPSGVQRPKMSAASAMKPRPFGHLALERVPELDGQVGARQAREQRRPGSRCGSAAAMTSIPTVSAASGCSPTARVRRPQRERKSRICSTMTPISSASPIGPCPNRALNSQPMHRQLGERLGRLPAA